MIAGWQTGPDGKRYFFHEDTGEKMHDCWIEWKGDYYFLKSDGTMAASEWIAGCWVAADGRYDPDIHHNSEGWTTVSRRV